MMILFKTWRFVEIANPKSERPVFDVNSDTSAEDCSAEILQPNPHFGLLVNKLKEEVDEDDDEPAKTWNTRCSVCRGKTGPFLKCKKSGCTRIFHFDDHVPMVEQQDKNSIRYTWIWRQTKLHYRLFCWASYISFEPFNYRHMFKELWMHILPLFQNSAVGIAWVSLQKQDWPATHDVRWSKGTYTYLTYFSL